MAVSGHGLHLGKGLFGLLWAGWSMLSAEPAVEVKLHRQLETKLLQEREFWVQKDFVVAKPFGSISEREALSLWAGLGNVSFSHTQSPDPALLLFARKSMMALATHPSWFGEREFEGRSAVGPTVVLAYAYQQLSEALSAQESEMLLKRLESQLLKYKAVVEGRSEVSWWPMTLHVDVLPHLAVMKSLMTALEESRPKVVAALKDPVLRAWRRCLHLLELHSDGGSPYGVEDGLWADWALLCLVEAEPNGEEAKVSLEWLKKRERWYRQLVLPGQDKFWSSAHELGGATPLMPVLFALASQTNSEHLQHLALSLQKSKHGAQDPWAYQSALWHDSDLSENIVQQPRFESFESGYYFGRENRRLRGSFFAFMCGQPAGSAVFQARLDGRESMDLSGVEPLQSSWSWWVKGREAFAASFRAEALTEHSNALLIDGEGQWFEPYPRRRQDEWLKPGVGGQLFLNERHGQSWLLGGSFAGAYPDHLGLVSYDRVMLWLGPQVMVEISRIKLDRERGLSVGYVSPELPLSKREDGAYQKVSGLRLKSGSFPKGEWRLSHYRDARGRDVSRVIEEVRAVKEWSRCVLICPQDMAQDAWFESLSDGIHMDFFDRKYRLVYRFEDETLSLNFEAHGKTFFDVKVDLP